MNDKIFVFFEFNIVVCFMKNKKKNINNYCLIVFVNDVKGKNDLWMLLENWL